MRFNEVDFGKGKQRAVEVRARNASDGAKGVLEIRLDKPDGPVLGRVQVGAGAEWQDARGSARKIPAGVHDLYVTQAGAEAVEVDWVRFR